MSITIGGAGADLPCLRESEVLTLDGRGDAYDEVLIGNVQVFDGTGMTAADSVRVRGGLITEVGVGLSPRPGARVVEAAGGTLLPELIDPQVHPSIGSRNGTQRSTISRRLTYGPAPR